MDFLKRLFQRTPEAKGASEVKIIGGGFGDTVEKFDAEEGHVLAVENPDEIPATAEEGVHDDINPSMDQIEGQGEEKIDHTNAENEDAINTDRAKENMKLNVRNLIQEPEAAKSTTSKGEKAPSATGTEPAGAEPIRARDSRQGTSRKTARSSAEETPRETTDTSETANNDDDEDDDVEIKFSSVACGYAHTVVVTDSGLCEY
jgi:hypothetical protein